MQQYNAKEEEYSVIRSNDVSVPPLPYFRDSSGEKNIVCVSPNHGRSYVLCNHDGRYIVGKGNGLSYTQYSYIHSREFDDYTWGLLLANEAIRDFEIGIEVHDLGIKTNIMQYVIELKKEIILANGHVLHPVLLQYSVESPYRICDAAYVSRNKILEQVASWDAYNKRGYSESHLVAAEVLVGNLQILHSNQILHNAIHPQNYTWALELLDFEISCSPKHPYGSKEESRIVKDLFSRELLQTYDIINHIAAYLNETVNHIELENIFSRHGFDIKSCSSSY